MDASEIVRVTAIYSSAGASEQQNVFIFQYQGVTVDDDDVLDDITTWFMDTWGPAWQDMASSDSTLTRFEADVITTTGTVDRNLGGDLLDITGSLVVDILTAAASAWLMAYTENPKQRGSKYIPGIAESITSGGLLTAGGLADLAVLLAVFLGDMPVETVNILRPGIWSRTLETFVKFSGSGLIEARPAYQRRRKKGVGI